VCGEARVEIDMLWKKRLRSSNWVRASVRVGIGAAAGAEIPYTVRPCYTI